MALASLERFIKIVLLVELFNLLVSYPKSASLYSFKVSPLSNLLITKGKTATLH